MVVTTLHTKVLDDLCCKGRLDLMDSIDTLRSQGINHFVSLPQIIVCGDQSSGKSSVLEAISGVSFPIKSNLCTRFPTELVLRRTAQTGASVSIVPHHSRPDAEKTALAGFHEVLQSFEGLSDLVEAAKSAMGITAHGKAFSRDLLRVEISGPDRPHLTIVDLPGLIHSETKSQSASDVDLIQDVVESYMKEPRSIILAVVSAKNDFANQVILKLARCVDPTGTRTLGVITKPDTLYPGSGTESQYISLARNQEVEFRLGWHVLKNLDSEASYEPLMKRDEREAEFFAGGIWRDLPESSLGIGQLRSRLSKVLLNHITEELPSLIEEIEMKRDSCRDKLEKLGVPRETLQEQQLHMIGISESFQRLVRSAVDGNWDDPFFSDEQSSHGYERRIRSLVQNLNEEFAKVLARQGHRRQIVDDKNKSAPGVCINISRDEFIDYIREKIRTSRGRELPGLFHPMVVADVFREQAGPWDVLARKHVRACWKACREFLKHVVGHVADAATSSAINRKILQPAMDSILAALDAKTDEILAPHQKSHPITYNHYFTDTIQSVRRERDRSRTAKVITGFFGITDQVQDSGTIYSISGNYNIRNLITLLTESGAEPDMHRFAASEVLDRMDAYYKVRASISSYDVSLDSNLTIRSP
jgi:GTPase SAR1 family protein